jgi:hypothetical protein
MRISKMSILVTGLLATVGLTLVGCSGKDLTNPDPKPPVASTSPTSSSSPIPSFSPSSSPTSSPSVAPQSEFNQTDQAFLVEIETYARNQGTTFSDVSPSTNIKTAKTICEGIQNNGVSNSFDSYIKASAQESENNQAALGYVFSASVKYYCPQYLSDVGNAIKNYPSNQ